MTLTTPPEAWPYSAWYPPVLHLRFLDEIERQTVAEGSEHDRVRPERAVAAVRDVHAVDDVTVLEAAAAGNRRVRLANLTAAADAGREVERVTESAAHRNAVQELAVERGPDCRGRGVDHGRRALDLHRFSHAGDLHREREIDALPDAHLNVLAVERAEARKVDFDLVVAWRKEGREEPPVGIGRERATALRRDDRHRRARHREPLCVSDSARNRASRGLLRGHGGRRGQDQERKNSHPSLHRLPPA